MTLIMQGSPRMQGLLSEYQAALSRSGWFVDGNYLMGVFPNRAIVQPNTFNNMLGSLIERQRKPWKEGVVIGHNREKLAVLVTEGSADGWQIGDVIKCRPDMIRLVQGGRP